MQRTQRRDRHSGRTTLKAQITAHSDRLYIRRVDFYCGRMLDEMDGEHESVPACFSEEHAAHSL